MCSTATVKSPIYFAKGNAKPVSIEKNNPLFISNSGLYVVTLNNTELISVNADDPRRAELALKVSKSNCKFGKAKNLSQRVKNYQKTFGERNVNFYVIALVAEQELDVAETRVLAQLQKFRQRSPSNRVTEWLAGISLNEVICVAHSQLNGVIRSYQQTVSVGS